MNHAANTSSPSFDADGHVIDYFGPFASQDDAMNFAEGRKGQWAEKWSVTALNDPDGPTCNYTREELLRLGWRGVDLNSPADVAAQGFDKTLTDEQIESNAVLGQRTLE